MKALDYYNLYHQQIMDPRTPLTKVQELVREIVIELCDEAEELALTRHVKTDEPFVSILKEQNQKWNAIIRLFNKKDGVSPLKKDGFITLVMELVPAYKKALGLRTEEMES